jgi:hypothetical protein
MNTGTISATTWRKSSYSNGQANCVEVAVQAPCVAVRDSKDPTGPVLRFGEVEWRDFLEGVRNSQIASC